MTQRPPSPPSPRPAGAAPGAGTSRAHVERQHPRIPISVGAEVIFGRDDSTAARTHDLSVGGARLLIRREIKEGDPLAVSLFLTADGVEAADLEPLTLKAVCAWAAEGDDGVYTVGCRFIAVKPAEQETLEAFLAQVTEQP